ncbi:hypothetical protein AKJ09_01807 [Labilithrix luteola]|uniref:Uncharacterized protein n=1 Tax=Labilithrix luteola TaxID=1391654 RepID=A0A0K1PNN8_9BACT|nr:hypothetical protein AKJ09_01807 [Labilithrix luteola]
MEYWQHCLERAEPRFLSFGQFSLTSNSAGPGGGARAIDAV